MKRCYGCMQPIENEKLHTCPHCGASLDLEAVPPQFLQPGTVLQNKFIVGKAIGSGGFGNTYIGWNETLLCKVAIKEFYPGQICERDSDGITVRPKDAKSAHHFRAGLQSFLEEARSVANLQDIKGVVAIYTFFEQNGTGYIVMEYLEGMDVKSILKQSGNKKDYEWCRRVILTVLHTLKDIHKRGVLHRDIAPDNVFVTNEGVIKLIDFGAAKHASELANIRTEIVLKQGYAPIEQYSKTAPQGPYTDLYAVAALFYRMLTGMKPIPANNRVNEDSLIPPSSMGIELPEQAELAMMCCLNVKPQYRLQTAGDFMEALGGQNFQPVYEPEWILPPPPPEHGRLVSHLLAMKTGTKVLLILCVIGLAGAMAGAVTWYVKQNNAKVQTSEQMKAMPDCTGKSLEEAKQLLNNTGIKNISEPIYEYDTQKEEDTVIEQSVVEGSAVSGDTSVQFTVSGGTNKFTMKDCASMTREDAVRYFEDKGIAVTVEETYSDEIPNRSLVSQTVGAGEVYTKGESASPVVLVYSVGKKSDYEKKMPKLTGLSVNEAKALLKSRGITVPVVVKSGKNYSTVSKGKVDSQLPEKGQIINIREDKQITLVKSKGVEPTPELTQTPVPSSATTKPKSMKKKSVKKKPSDEDEVDFTEGDADEVVDG